VFVFGWSERAVPRSTSSRPHEFFASKAVLQMSTSGDKNVPGRLLVSNLSALGTPTCRLILASQSPRRREILDMMGLGGRYTAEPSPLDESALQEELSGQPHVSPEVYARTLAEHKAEAMGMHMIQNDKQSVGSTLVLGSDTIVDLDGHILEKPTDKADATNMLKKLAGNWHKVHTGVALYHVRPGVDEALLISSFTDTANVKFADLTDTDILAYVETGEPMDKAGSYGIQGVGGQLVETMEGDFFTVMGLPMHRLSRTLTDVISSIS